MIADRNDITPVHAYRKPVRAYRKPVRAYRKPVRGYRKPRGRVAKTMNARVRALRNGARATVRHGRTHSDTIWHSNSLRERVADFPYIN